MATRKAPGVVAASSTPPPAAPWGTHQCPACSAQVERAYPGYPPAVVLELHCSACGSDFLPSAETLAG